MAPTLIPVRSFSYSLIYPIIPIQYDSSHQKEFRIAEFATKDVNEPNKCPISDHLGWLCGLHSTVVDTAF